VSVPDQTGVQIPLVNLGRGYFGADIPDPRMIKTHRVFAYRFGGTRGRVTPDRYWRDVGTVDAYWEANLDLTSVTPDLNLYDPAWPIVTYQEQLPPAKFVFDDETRRGMAVDSLVSGGCIVSGAEVRGSLLFSKVRVNSYARLQNAVLLPDVHVGRSARLTKVVVDRGVIIPEGLVAGEDPVEDARRFHVSEGGVTLITQEMIDRIAAGR
jgi:glucose-1-phosphate adenylyltransferase